MSDLADIDALIARELDPQAEAALRQRMHVDPALRAEADAQARLDRTLAVLFAPAEAPRRVTKAAMATLAASHAPQRRAQVRRRSAPLRILRLVGLAAAAILIAAVGLRTFVGSQAPRADLPLVAGSPSSVLPGTVIGGADETLSLTWNDGSTARLMPGARLVLHDPAIRGKCLELLAGTITCSVAPQPSETPWTVVTPHAVVAVVGTVFTVTHADDSTVVAVESGQVVVNTSRAGAAARLGPGESWTSSAVDHAHSPGQMVLPEAAVRADDHAHSAEQIVLPETAVTVRAGGFSDTPPESGEPFWGIKRTRKSDNNREVFVRFPPLPANRTLRRATLRLHAHDVGEPVVDLDLIAVSEAWDERSITWSTRPEGDRHLGSLSAVERQDVLFDVTDAVRDSLRAQQPFALRLTATAIGSPQSYIFIASGHAGRPPGIALVLEWDR